MGTYIDANFVFHGYLRDQHGKIVTVDPVGSTFTFPPPSTTRGR